MLVHNSRGNLFSVVVLLVLSCVKGLPQSPFLHEILQGRCYARPVDANGDPSRCPSIVGSLMGAFAGKLDQDVQVQDFSAYLQVADFLSPENGALFVVGDNGGGGDDARIKNHTRPEDTRGGAIVAGITFCAQDKVKDCPGISPPNKEGEFRGTENALWAGIYQAFAKQVKGQLSIAVLQPDKDASLITKAAIPALNPESVSTAHIFVQSGDCASSNAVVQVKDALNKRGISSDCAEDPYLFSLALCTGTQVSHESCALVQQVSGKASSENKEAASTTNQESDRGTKSHFWPKCLLILLLAAGVAFFFKNQTSRNKHYSEIPILVDK